MADPFPIMPPANDPLHEPTPNRGDDSCSGKPRCFVAYPSAPADRAETIETAIGEIQSGGAVDIIGWKSVSVAGRSLIDAVCEEIRRCQIFAADVTGLNPNVLFELGYAVAHRRRVWLLLNPNIHRAKADWERFQLLTTVGFALTCPRFPRSRSYDTCRI